MGSIEPGGDLARLYMSVLHAISFSIVHFVYKGLVGLSHSVARKRNLKNEKLTKTTTKNREFSFANKQKRVSTLRIKTTNQKKKAQEANKGARRARALGRATRHQMGEGLPRKCGIGKRRRFRDNRADSLDQDASLQRLTDVASSSVDSNRGKDGKLSMLVGLSRPLAQICHDQVHSTASLPKRQQQHVTNRQKNSRKRARRRQGMLESGEDYQTAIFRADLDLKTEQSNMNIKSGKPIPRNRRPVRLKSIARRSNNDCLEEKKPCDSDSAEKLCAGVYRVEFTQSKYVWHGSTWCVSSAESEVSKMLRRGRHPHMGMQRAFNRGERTFLVTVVDRMGMFTEFPMAEEDRVRTFEKSGRKGKGRCVKQGHVMDSNRVEESLARRVESIHNQFVKKRVRFTLRSWRRTRLLPAFTALRNQMERLRATENCAAATEIQRFVRGKAARHLLERLSTLR